MSDECASVCASGWGVIFFGGGRGGCQFVPGIVWVTADVDVRVTADVDLVWVSADIDLVSVTTDIDMVWVTADVDWVWSADIDPGVGDTWS